MPSELTDAQKKLLLSTQIQYLTWVEISEHLKSINSSEFNGLINKHRSFTVKSTPENISLINQLKTKDIIGTIKTEDSKMQCYIKPSNLD